MKAVAVRRSARSSLSRNHPNQQRSRLRRHALPWSVQHADLGGRALGPPQAEPVSHRGHGAAQVVPPAYRLVSQREPKPALTL